jgi:hypothetical protein
MQQKEKEYNQKYEQVKERKKEIVKSNTFSILRSNDSTMFKEDLDQDFERSRIKTGSFKSFRM